MSGNSQMNRGRLHPLLYVWGMIAVPSVVALVIALVGHGAVAVVSAYILLGLMGIGLVVAATTGLVSLVQPYSNGSHFLPATEKDWRRVCVAFLSIALVSFFVGGGLGSWTLGFVKGASSARGTVVELSASRSEGVTYYRPVIEFQASDGSTHRAQTWYGVSRPRYAVGDELDILYSAKRPTMMIPDDPIEIWTFAAVILIIGMAFVIAFLVPIWILRDKQALPRGSGN